VQDNTRKPDLGEQKGSGLRDLARTKGEKPFLRKKKSRKKVERGWSRSAKEPVQHNYNKHESVRKWGGIRMAPDVGSGKKKKN